MTRIVWSSSSLMEMPALVGSCIEGTGFDPEVGCQNSSLVSNSTDAPMCEPVCLESVKRSL